jgi:2'-hydroxyisoflavone reductase
VYAGFPPDGTDERSVIATITQEQLRHAEALAAGSNASASAHGELYGGLKVLCEQAAETALPGRVLNVRPGLIVGADDYMDRFTYWVRRVAQGGEVLAPGRPQRRVRVIDARDLADWTVRMAEAGRAGVFNATGAEDGLTMGRMLDVCRTVSGSDARFRWTDDELLIERGVQPWTELPLWVPEAYNGIFETRNDKAIASGLSFRTLAETTDDVLRWDATRRQDAPMKAGLARERERELLDAPHRSH